MNAPMPVEYRPPTRILEVLQKIQYDEALTADDPRYVNTDAARGILSVFPALAMKFSWDPVNNDFLPPSKRHVLFFGHMGSGKSTELRRCAKEFNASGRFFVIQVNALDKLNASDLVYSDLLLAMAESLLEALIAARMDFDQNDLKPIRDWFSAVTRTSTQLRDSSVEVKAGLDASAGLPGLLKLFASLTSVIKTGVTYKKEWREEVTSRYGDLAVAFNGLVKTVEVRLRQNHRAERVLFVVDGTDKLMHMEQTVNLFVYNASQINAIDTLAVYTAPLSLKFDGRSNVSVLAEVTLPMIKLYESGGERCEAGWRALTDLLLLRADRSLFASDEDIALLIEHCGGHPRELLRLLQICCEYVTDRIDTGVVRRAIIKLAAEYRYFLNAEHYKRLAEIDAAPKIVANESIDQHLIHRLALLQYNDGAWRRSHPVVRTLEGYKAAKVALAASASTG